MEKAISFEEVNTAAAEIDIGSEKVSAFCGDMLPTSARHQDKRT